MSFENNTIITSEMLIEDAALAFDLARAALRARINVLRAAPDTADDSKDIQGLIAQLGKTLSAALEQTVKVEHERCKTNGGLGGGALDLDAARVEIGSRLARLRAAGNG